jgi:hypothetical protein
VNRHRINNFARGFLKSAQAAGRGFIGIRNSADLAAPGESVVREFLQRL